MSGSLRFRIRETEICILANSLPIPQSPQSNQNIMAPALWD